MAAKEDSVPLDYVPPPEEGRRKKARVGPASLKMLFALFVLFLTVVSDPFAKNVIAGFGERAVSGRQVTPFGVVLQGTFLVITFAIAVALVDNEVI